MLPLIGEGTRRRWPAAPGRNEKLHLGKAFYDPAGSLCKRKVKNFSPLHVVVAALVADPTLPVKLRLRALQASHRLRFGVVGPDEERWLRRLHAWRRRQLEVAARAYGVGRPR